MSYNRYRDDPNATPICGAASNRHGWSLVCIDEPDHDGDHASAYGLFWADGVKPYPLAPGQRRGTNGAPEPIGGP